MKKKDRPCFSTANKIRLLKVEYLKTIQNYVLKYLYDVHNNHYKYSTGPE